MNTYLLVGVLPDGACKPLLAAQAATIEEAAGKLGGRVEKAGREDDEMFFPGVEWGAFTADQTGKVLVKAVETAFPEAAVANDAGREGVANVFHRRDGFARVLLGRILNV